MKERKKPVLVAVIWLIMASALFFSCCQSNETQQNTEAQKIATRPTTKVTYIYSNANGSPPLYLVEFEGKRFLMQYHGGLTELKE
jgi:hypothetical protein